MIDARVLKYLVKSVKTSANQRMPRDNLLDERMCHPSFLKYNFALCHPK